MLIHRL